MTSARNIVLTYDYVTAGEFNDHVFEGLDFVLAEARRRGILVILTLVNYWGDYGGMLQVHFRGIRAYDCAAALSATLGTAPVQQPMLRPHRCIDSGHLTAEEQCSAELPTDLVGLFILSMPNGVRPLGAATQAAPSPSTSTRTPGRRTSSATTLPP